MRSGADSCTISVLLKPYLCNWSPRVCLTCGWSRFQLRSPLSLRCPSGKMSVHYLRPQRNLILPGMFDSFFQLPAFLEEGDNYLCLPLLNRRLHSLSKYRLRGCLSEIIRVLSPTLKPEQCVCVCVPRVFRLLPLGQVYGNTIYCPDAAFPSQPSRHWVHSGDVVVCFPRSIRAVIFH